MTHNNISGRPGGGGGGVDCVFCTSMTSLQVLKMRPKMTLILKLNSDVWDPFEALDRIDEKIINNIQKLMYNFSILKVITVCINGYAS